jgi:hypothetical protein
MNRIHTRLRQTPGPTFGLPARILLVAKTTPRGKKDTIVPQANLGDKGL